MILQCCHHLVAKAFVVYHISKQVKVGEPISQPACDVAGNFTKAYPVHVHFEDGRFDGEQANDFLLAFLPARRTRSSEERRTVTNNVFVNRETLLLRTYKDSDRVTVIATSKA